MKIITIIGTRPQFIKLIPDLGTILIDTGQHYDDEMSKNFISELGIKKPDYSLGETSLSGMIYKLIPILKKEKPDLVIVYGDTRSTLAGAISAKELKIKLAHIEAGVRCYDNSLPEENNRKIVDHLSDYLFCPTEEAVANLHKEGIEKNVFFVGDVLYDRFLEYRSQGRYVLVTIHRQENVNKERLQEIINSLKPYKKVVFPVHPRTRKCIEESGIKVPDNILLVAPFGYGESLRHIQSAELVITDSGGVQREAYWCGVPCQVLREKSEWKNYNPYGDGTAGKQIKQILGGIDEGK